MRRLALLALSALVAAVTLVLAATTGDLPRMLAAVLQSAFPVVGAVIVRHRPRNAVGWSFLVAGLLTLLAGLGDVGLHAGLARGWAPGLLYAFGWANATLWFPGLFLLITVSLVHFPEGALSSRWRLLSWAALGLMTVYVAGFSLAVTAVPLTELAGDGTPSAAGWRGVAVTAAEACLPATLPVVLGAVASLVVRWRRGGPVQRLQLRWVAAAGTLAVATEIALDLLGAGDEVQTVLESTVFALIAVATGIAITRHGLYEIDRIVSRTATYLAVTAVLAAVYVGVVALAGLLVPAGAGSVGVAAATLAAVALFVPLRRRVQRLVDRRFHRSRYDAERVVAAFAERVRGMSAATLTPADLAATADRALQPAHVTVWLVGDRA